MVEPTWNWTLEREFPSNIDIGHEIVSQLLEALEKNGWEGRDAFHIHMAVEEAIVNAIEHGNQRDEQKIVEIRFCIGTDEVRLVVSDQGDGFDPSQLRDPTLDEHLDIPRGRGVLLIRELMTSVSYNQKGNRVSMIKKRSRETSEAS